MPATSFLKNVWHMAAWSNEIGEGALLRRKIIGEPIVFYRTKNGAAAALTDRCPHRFAPLSMGEHQGDSIRCGYHGLVFDKDGGCIHNPYSDLLPKAARVRSWPIAERDGIVWIWTGGAQEADPAKIPDFSALERPCGPPVSGYMLMQANYEYGTDNLMDLSHIEFVHKGSFAGAGVIFAGKHTSQDNEDSLHSNWWMPDVAAPAHTMGIYERDMRTDHWLDMRWEAPASMRLEIGATPKNAPREQGVIVHQAHILTPETERTSHYFWATTRTFDRAEPEGDSFLKGLMSQAFDQEDKPMIEAAFSNLDGADFWSMKPLSLGVDTAGARARRKLEQMIRKEAHDASLAP